MIPLALAAQPIPPIEIKDAQTMLFYINLFNLVFFGMLIVRRFIEGRK